MQKMEYFKKWLKEVNQFLPLIDDLQYVVKSYLPEFYFETSLMHFKNCVQTKDAIYNEQLLALQRILMLHVHNDEEILKHTGRFSIIHSQSCFQRHKERLCMRIRIAKAKKLPEKCISNLIDDLLKWKAFENNEDKHLEFICKLYVELFLDLWLL